jgi:hypothetical protein
MLFMEIRINISYDNINVPLNFISTIPSIKPVLGQIRPGMAGILLQRGFHLWDFKQQTSLCSVASLTLLSLA